MRRIELAQLTAFATVAEQRSFTRAASQLGMSPPSLSAIVRGLEEMLGVRLLNRTTRSVALTEAGEQLLGRLGAVFEGVEKAIDAVNAFRDTPGGTLRLAVDPVAAVTVIAPLVARFAVAYPAIRLEISVDGAHKDITGDRFDAGIRFGDDVAQDMIAVAVGERFRLGTVAAPQYLAHRAAPATPEDLALHNCVHYRWSGASGAGSWRFARGARQLDVPVEGTLTVNDRELALRAALDGVGVVQLPDMWVSSFVADGRLVPVLEDWSLPASRCWLYFSSSRHMPTKLRALIDFLRRDGKPAEPHRQRAAGRGVAAAPARSVDVDLDVDAPAHARVRLMPPAGAALEPCSIA